MYRREIEPSRRIVFLDSDAAFSVRMTRNQYWPSSERKLEEFFKLKREYPKTEYPYETICRAANDGRHGPQFMRRFDEIVSKWDAEAVRRLSEFLRKEKARFVLTSSDRESFGRDALLALFSYHEIDDLFQDMTVTPSPLFLQSLSRRSADGSAPREFLTLYTDTMRDIWRALNRERRTLVRHRAVEIREYLDRHPEIEAFAVIDSQDLSSGIGRRRMVRCSKHLASKDIQRLSTCLNRTDALPRLPSSCDMAQLDQFRRTSVACLYRRWRDPRFSGTQTY